MMTIFLTLVGALCLAWYVSGGSYMSTSGAYVIEVKKLELCSDEGTKEVHFGTKLTKIDKDRTAYNSSFWMHVPLDKDFKTYADVQQWGNGGYKARYIEYTANNCDESWKIMGSFLKSLMKSTGTEVTSCPIPQGNYTANSWIVKFTLDNIKTMTYNKYKVVLTFKYKGRKVGCLIIYIEVKQQRNMG